MRLGSGNQPVEVLAKLGAQGVGVGAADQELQRDTLAVGIAPRVQQLEKLVAPHPGPRPGDQPQHEPELVRLRALLGRHRLQLVLEHVHRLLPAPQGVERDRVLAGKTVSDFLVLIGLRVLLVRLELRLVDGPHPQADLLGGEEETRPLEAVDRRRVGLLVEAGGLQRLAARVRDHSLEEEAPAPLRRVELLGMRRGEVRLRLVDPLAVGGHEAGPQVPACAAKADERIKRLAGARHVALVQERRGERQGQAAAVGARGGKHRAIEGDRRGWKPEGLGPLR